MGASSSSVPPVAIASSERSPICYHLAFGPGLQPVPVSLEPYTAAADQSDSRRTRSRFSCFFIRCTCDSDGVSNGGSRTPGSVVAARKSQEHIFENYQSGNEVLSESLFSSRQGVSYHDVAVKAVPWVQIPISSKGSQTDPIVETREAFTRTSSTSGGISSSTPPSNRTAPAYAAHTTIVTFVDRFEQRESVSPTGRYYLVFCSRQPLHSRREHYPSGCHRSQAHQLSSHLRKLLSSREPQ